MSLNLKLLQFTKKALLKQLEGYKGLVSLKEHELNTCLKEKTEAERIANALSLALSKVNSYKYILILIFFHR